LINPATWQTNEGEFWTYPGMMVVVAKDSIEGNNGLYILQRADYTQISNW
jgi:hypothetical protein